MRYTKESALKMINRNRLRIYNNDIYIPIGRIVGIKLWGAIDYLVNQHGFIYYFEEKIDVLPA
jgi:hypothetical protein